VVGRVERILGSWHEVEQRLASSPGGGTGLGRGRSRQLGGLIYPGFVTAPATAGW
jgi:hypothetical protein